MLRTPHPPQAVPSMFACKLDSRFATCSPAGEGFGEIAAAQPYVDETIDVYLKPVGTGVPTVRICKGLTICVRLLSNARSRFWSKETKKPSPLEKVPRNEADEVFTNKKVLSR